MGCRGMITTWTHVEIRVKRYQGGAVGVILKAAQSQSRTYATDPNSVARSIKTQGKKRERDIKEKDTVSIDIVVKQQNANESALVSSTHSELPILFPFCFPP